MYVLICAAVFLAAYLLNTTMISVFYHRGLAHRAVALRPGARAFAARYGIWLTGLDAKGWVCMHRKHHRHSDSSEDPHRKGLWFMPYVLHLIIALAIVVPTGMWALAACYFVGMMSHPFEGWIVNSLGHAVGGRNFETADNSRNNHLAAWLILGEGYQNNHHRYPASAKFSYQPWELDFGFGVSVLLEKLGVLEIQRELLLPSPSSAIRGLAHE